MAIVLDGKKVAGQIKADLTGKDKATLTPEKLAAYFE